MAFVDALVLASTLLGSLIYGVGVCYCEVIRSFLSAVTAKFHLFYWGWVDADWQVAAKSSQVEVSPQEAAQGLQVGVDLSADHVVVETVRVLGYMYKPQSMIGAHHGKREWRCSL